MRLVFVSGTTVGGSGRSQRELAAQLESFGHEVRFLVDDGRPARVTRWIYEQSADASTRWGHRPGRVVLTWLEQRAGRRTRTVVVGGRQSLASVVPQNALPASLRDWKPDLVVASSVERLAWRRIHRSCRRFGIPVGLYVREDDSLSHLALGEVPDLLVANAESLALRLRGQGFDCAFVPSVVDVAVTRVEPTRTTALAINPIPSRGIDIVWKVAERLPHVPFVVQESWPLSPDEIEEVQRHSTRFPNVEFRRAAPPGPALYRDCRVLLVPYKVDNRPRVIAEAHANGIPVIAADVPALREAIGDGGVVVPADDIDAWVAGVKSLWSDDVRYQELVRAARSHSTRGDIDPVAVARSFESLAEQLVDAGQTRR